MKRIESNHRIIADFFVLGSVFPFTFTVNDGLRGEFSRWTFGSCKIHIHTIIITIKYCSKTEYL